MYKTKVLLLITRLNSQEADNEAAKFTAFNKSLIDERETWL